MNFKAIDNSIGCFVFVSDIIHVHFASYCFVVGVVKVQFGLLSVVVLEACRYGLSFSHSML